MKPFENTVGKGENAGDQHFLLFPQCFLPFPKEISIFQSHLFCCLQGLSIWTSLKICRLVKRLLIHSESVPGSMSKASTYRYFEKKEVYSRSIFSSSTILHPIAEPHSSVGSVQDLRAGGRPLDPLLVQNSFRELVIVIVAGFIPLPQLSIVSKFALRENSQWLGFNIARGTGTKNPRTAWVGALAAAI